MKSLLLILIGLVYSNNCFSQSFIKTFENKGSFFTLTIVRSNDDSIKADFGESDGTKITEQTFSPFSYEQFKIWLVKQLKNKANISLNTIDIEIENKVLNLYYETIAQLMTKSREEGPIAGSLTIYNQVPVIDTKNTNVKSIKSIKDYSSIGVPYRIKNIQLEVLEGFLENITVVANADSTVLNKKDKIFSNVFGIGFASKTNMSSLFSYWLIEKNKPFDEALRMNLGELLRFDIHHEPGRRDYSPRDGIYSFVLSDTPINTELRKDPLKRLIEARIFSDIVGLNQENPNGLVQTEVFKRINMNTNRSLAFQDETFLNKFCRFILGQGVGILQYVTPIITLSKFEENNKRLLVNRSQDTIAMADQHQSFTRIINGKPILLDSILQSATLSGRPAVTAIDLLRYQNFSAGIDLNLLYAENVGGKFNFYLDAGIRFGRTALRDSTNQVSTTVLTNALTKNEIRKTGSFFDLGVNTFQFYPELKIQWLPEERFGVTLSRRWTYLSLRNGDYAQGQLRLGSYDYHSKNIPLVPEQPHNWIGTWEIFTFIKAGDNGKLFFRYRLNNEIGNRAYNFHQAQVGYSFSILGNRQTSTKAKTE